MQVRVIIYDKTSTNTIQLGENEITAFEYYVDDKEISVEETTPQHVV